MPCAFAADGTEVSYVDEGSGTPVVFVHGTFTDRSVFAETARALRPDYRTVRVDLRGHGDSEVVEGPYTLPAYASDVRAVVAALELGEHCYVGWSLGAKVGLSYLPATRDVAAAGLISSGLFHEAAPAIRRPGEHVDYDRLRSALAAGDQSVLADLARGLFGPGAPERHRERLARLTSAVPLRVALAHLDAMAATDAGQFGAALRGIGAPTLVGHGVHDDAATVASAAHVADALLPDGHLVTFAESGHVPFLEEPGAFRRALRAHLP